MFNLGSLPSIIRTAAERVLPVVTRDVSKLESVGKAAIALVNEAGHHVVKEAGEDISHLMEHGFHVLDQNGNGIPDALEGLAHGVPDDVVSALDRATGHDDIEGMIRSAVKATKAEYEETMNRIMAQRDAAVAELNAIKAQLGNGGAPTAQPRRVVRRPR